MLKMDDIRSELMKKQIKALVDGRILDAQVECLRDTGDPSTPI